MAKRPELTFSHVGIWVTDLEAMLLEYWKQPNSQQLNIRIPKGAKKMIERLARRKTVEGQGNLRQVAPPGVRTDQAAPVRRRRMRSD